MKRFCAGFILVMGCTMSLWADKGSVGTATAQFLKLPAGARASAMGEAYGAVSNDASAVFWNPAGLSSIYTKQVALTHAIWFENIGAQWFSYVQPTKLYGTVGAGVQYLSYGSIKETDDTGLETGSFSPTDMAATVSYGKNIKGIDAGISLKYISSRIKNSAVAYAIDAGVLYHFTSGNAVVGAMVQNAGTRMKYISEEDPLPMNTALCGAFNFGSDWTLALDVNMPSDGEINVCTGVENRLMLSDQLMVAERIGYTTKTKAVSGLKGVGIGVGISYTFITLDYAFVPFGDLGNTHRISILAKF